MSRQVNNNRVDLRGATDKTRNSIWEPIHLNFYRATDYRGGGTGGAGEAIAPPIIL